MSSVTRTTIAVNGNTLSASVWNNEFNNLLNALNLVNTDISASAAIAASKISGTAATLSGTNTYTGPQVYPPTVMSAQAINGASGNNFTRTLAGSETFTQSNFTPGQFFIVRVQQGSGTSYSVTWFSTITWITNGGTAPTQTTVSNGVTTYGFECTGVNTFDGYLVGTN